MFIAGAVIITLIPIELRFRFQNSNDEKDNVIFSIGWLFSALSFMVSADLSGMYEYRLVIFGYNVMGKRDILIDEKDI